MRLAFSCRSLAAFAMLLLALSACSNWQTAGQPPANAPLYDRLGGKPVLAAIVDDFVANVAADPRIARRFAASDNAHFKAALVDQLCVTTGGPCKYSGRPMKDTHASMDISDAEFNAMTQDLRRAMGRLNIAVDLQVEFAAAMEPLRNDVVSPLPPTQSVVTSQMVHRPGAQMGPAQMGPAHSGPAHHASAKKPASKKPVVKKASTPARTPTPPKPPSNPQ